jgi:hypothetical protein
LGVVLDGHCSNSIEFGRLTGGNWEFIGRCLSIFRKTPRQFS